MTRTLRIFFLFFSCVYCCYAQSFEHRKFKYNWNDEQRITFSKSPSLADYNAVILYEETTIDIELSNIKRYQVYQFDDSLAIQNFNLFRVPISMDSRKDHIPGIYRTDTNNFPQLLYEQINFFDARIIRNGEFVKAVLDEVAYKTEELTGDRILPYFIHYFYVRNLEPGDQLEVVISHHYPYTARYYLNEFLPKQEVAIVVNTTPLHKIETFINENLARLDHIEQSDDRSTYRIVFKDLKPVDPSMPTDIVQLPRVDFIADKKYRVTNKPFGIQEIDTIKWKDVFHSISRYIDPGELRSWENYDNQSCKTSRFYDKLKAASGGNLSKVEFMNYIQQYCADRMGYKNDYRYFIHEEHGFPDLGSYLEKDTLREACRHSFYFNMLDRIDTTWYNAYIMDNRYEVLDTSRFGLLYPQNLSYVLIDKNSVPHFYYPKASRFGYYADELPFYLQDQFVYLLPQTLSRKTHDDFPNDIHYPVHYIQNTPPEYNTKHIYSRIDVSLKDRISSASYEVELSGQYSTLLRGYYMYGYKDSTISPSYYKDPFKNISILTTKKDSSQKVFPFFHRFTLQADQWRNVYINTDGYYLVDLKDLINIHTENVNEKYFKAPYLHDFAGTEIYTIDIRFDQMIRMDNTMFDHSYQGESFELVTSLKKITDNEYRWELKWTIKNQRTGPEELAALQEVFAAIQYFSKLQVRVRPL